VTREIRLNAFEMNCIAHQSPGLWRHPRDRAWEYKDLDYWTDLAKILEGGKFDAIFIADVLGAYDVLHGDVDAAVRHAAQIPVNDPLQVVPPMAAVTRNLGFGLTASVSFEHPYPFARRLSTLDHLTKGRAAWNIVTSYLESGAKNIGLTGQADHDERYEIAEEYLEVCYKLWEGSWEDGAVLRDRRRGIFADPSKVHPILHKGRYFETPGIHLCEPSPQRTPLLFQAGSSPRGKRFAGKHAECVFVSQPSRAALKRSVASIRAAAVEAGRESSAIKIFNMQTVIVDETDAKAQAKYKGYRDYVSLEGALALLSGWLGCDFGAYQPDTPLSGVNAKSVQSSLEAYGAVEGRGLKTVRDLADWVGVGGFGPLFVGSASTVADLMQAWIEETDVDGFNLTYAVAHETFADVAGYLVPELQRRGVFKHDYAPGALREKLFGAGSRLGEDHPAALYRNLATAASDSAHNFASST
jgi:FMN-dependent oxidoreductase (nitrilotriacetate monooxygenase family)